MNKTLPLTRAYAAEQAERWAGIAERRYRACLWMSARKIERADREGHAAALWRARHMLWQALGTDDNTEDTSS